MIGKGKKLNYEFILHVLIAIFTCCQVVFVLYKNSSYQLNLQRIFLNTFIDNDDKNDFDYKRNKFLYTPNEVKEFINLSMNNFLEMNNLCAFDQIKIKRNLEGLNKPVISYLKVDYIYSNLDLQDMKYDNKNYIKKYSPRNNSIDEDKKDLNFYDNNIDIPQEEDEERKVFDNEIKIVHEMKSTDYINISSHKPLLLEYYSLSKNNNHAHAIVKNEDSVFVTSKKEGFNNSLNSENISFINKNNPVQMPSLSFNEYYILYKNDLGPFDYNENLLFIFLNSVKSMKNVYKFYTSDNDDSEFEILWKITQNFDFTTRGHIEVKLDINYAYTSQSRTLQALIKKLFWIHLIVLFMSFISILVILNNNDNSSRYLLTNNYTNPSYKNKRTNENDYHLFEESAPLNQFSENIENNETGSNSSVYSDSYNKDKDGYLIKNNKHSSIKKSNNSQYWTICILIGNLLQIIGVLSTFSNLSKFESYNYIIVALGAAFAFISLGKYLQKYHGWNLIFTTISLSFKIIIMIFVSALPIYIGMMLLGKSIFWNSYFFSNLSLTSMSLFSLLQMDSTLDIFKVIVEENLILGIFYMIFFWMVLFAVSRRIFIVLIEDIYILIQLKNKKSFVLHHLPLEISHIDSGLNNSNNSFSNEYAQFNDKKETNKKLNNKNVMISNNLNNSNDTNTILFNKRDKSKEVINNLKFIDNSINLTSMKAKNELEGKVNVLSNNLENYIEFNSLKKENESNTNKLNLKQEISLNVHDLKDILNQIDFKLNDIIKN